MVYTFIIVNDPYEKNMWFVSKKNTTQHWFSYFTITNLSCLYVPQEHYCIGTLYLWNTDEYVIYLLLVISPSVSVIENIMYKRFNK